MHYQRLFHQQGTSSHFDLLSYPQLGKSGLFDIRIKNFGCVTHFRFRKPKDNVSQLRKSNGYLAQISLRDKYMNPKIPTS